jgi:hypothetical protein
MGRGKRKKWGNKKGRGGGQGGERKRSRDDNYVGYKEIEPKSEAFEK